MRNVAVIANGRIDDDKKILEKLRKYDYIIAADGGASHCFRLGITPDLIIGDFDSINDEAMISFAKILKKQFMKDKDETDLELAIIEAFIINPEKVTLFAATGNRADHTLVNLHILSRFAKRLVIETENETIFALNPEIAKPFEIKTIPGQTISLLPIGKPATGVTTKGLKWELNDASLDQNILSISNICLDNKASISMKTGDLLCFLLEFLN